MNSPKRLVLDANILLRAVVGIRVRHLLEAYEDVTSFYTPDTCFYDARRYIPALLPNVASIPLLPWQYSIK